MKNLVLFLIILSIVVLAYSIVTYYIKLKKERNKPILKTKKEKLALFNETIKYYSEDTNRISRNPQTGFCSYAPAHEQTQGCAVGRLLNPELQNKLDTIGVIDKAWHLIPIELQAFGYSLLARLQELHDAKYHWTPEGLSDRGLEVSEGIRKDIENGVI